jgi:Ran GTPase-activating protein (RanGAP) involved in mRNA processing and transport
MLGDESADYLYPCLKLHEDLQIIKFNSLNLSLLDAKAIGKVLADFKNIKELSLENCQLNQFTTKEIADGLMRAK